MSYTILIVDDEPIICNGLKKFVNWDELGFSSVYTAHSVAQALVLLEEHPIDVVMTDIRMPVQTGLDLLRILHTDYPTIKKLILSSYNDFEYAREAMHFGTLDFITKPVNFDELKTAMKKVTTLLSSDMTHSSLHKKHLHLEQDTALNNLVRGDDSPYNLSKLDKLGIKNQSDFLLFRIYLDIPTTSYDTLHESKNFLHLILTETFMDYGTAFAFNNALQELSCLFYPKSIMSIDNFFEELESQIKAKYTHHFAIGISNSYHELTDFKNAYAEAGKALQYRTIKHASFIKYREIDNILSYKDILTDHSKSQIITFLNENNFSDFSIFILSLIESIDLKTSYDSSQLYSFAIDTILLLYDYATNLHTEISNSNELRQTLKKVFTLSSASEIHEFILSYTSQLLDILNTQTGLYGNLIHTALLYIEEHYSENITLLTLADMLYLHPTYLSRLFKEKTGKNFLRYLTDLRIEKSKLLLADFSLKIYDISEMVGYESSKHYAKTFKAITGFTPREYRDQITP